MAKAADASDGEAKHEALIGENEGARKKKALSAEARKKKAAGSGDAKLPIKENSLPITESHNKRANAYTHAHTEAERGQVSRLSEKQVEEREEVENKEREAEAKRSVLVAKIAQLHNLLLKEQREARQLKSESIKSDRTTEMKTPPHPPLSPPPVTSAAAGRKKVETKARASALQEPAVKVWAVGKASTLSAFGKAAREPAADVMAPEDHTSKKSLREGLEVAQQVLSLVAARKQVCAWRCVWLVNVGVRRV